MSRQKEMSLVTGFPRFIREFEEAARVNCLPQDIQRARPPQLASLVQSVPSSCQSVEAV